METLTLLSVVASAALLAACASRYAPDSVWNDGGYSASKRAPGVYQVWFDGNEFSTLERIEDLAMLHAAELCLGENKPFMRMSDFDFDTRTTRYAQKVFVTRVPVYGDVTGTHNPTVQKYTTRVTPGPGRTLTAGQSGLLVTCLPEKADDTQESAVVAATIRERYGMAK